MRVLTLGLMAVWISAGEVALPAPTHLDLYLDGARFVHVLDLPAGRSRVALPPTMSPLVQIDGADGWAIESTITTPEPPAMPPALVELTALADELKRAAARLAEEGKSIAGVASQLNERLGQHGENAGDETVEWQAALDRLLGLRAGLAQRRLAHTLAWSNLRERAAAAAAPGITNAAAIGLDRSQVMTDLGDPAANARRVWSFAVELNVLNQTLVVERTAPGRISVITERNDVRWTPRARVVVAQGTTTLVRQAAVQVSAGLVLPTMSARFIQRPCTQDLAGDALVSRTVTVVVAPQAHLRSVTMKARPVSWGAGATGAADLNQSWDVPALTLAAPVERSCTVMTQLNTGPVERHADEWILAPSIAPVVMRRVSVRLDSQPLAAGVVELVIEGAVVGRRSVTATAPGSLLHFSAGEDHRVFLAETTRWTDDPNRSVNRTRSGSDYRLRNLSAEVVSFVCYVTQPVSEANGVTVTTDPSTTAGSINPQPGVLRWALTIEPGAELMLHHGWTVKAEGAIKL